MDGMELVRKCPYLYLAARFARGAAFWLYDRIAILQRRLPHLNATSGSDQTARIMLPLEVILHLVLGAVATFLCY